MPITLTVTEGPHVGQTFSFKGHDTFLVGRSKRAHFRLPAKDRYFSRIHFLVEVNPPQCRLTDMGSRNGTHVNGQRVQQASLKDGDQIRAGKTVLQVSMVNGSVDISLPPSQSTPSTLIPPSEIPAPILPEASVPARPVVPPVPAPSQPASSVPSIQTSLLKACRACGTAISVHPRPGSWLCAGCANEARGLAQPIPGFQMVRKLGQGAMGVVNLAIHERDGKAVALKTVTPAVAGSPAQMQRFLREAEILRKLRHPHIIGFHDMGETEGMFYFAMDFIIGQDAAKLLRRDGPFKVNRAVTLVCQLLDALSYAHASGFVHRDIKPSNLLISEEKGKETIRVVDFGLARVYQASQLSGLTLTGDIGGTMAFLPPEQITEYREAKPPADQYAAAATLYNLLTSQHIYDLPSEFHQQILMILQEEPVPILKRNKHLPAGLGTAIHRALGREPEDRFPSVVEFRDALLPFRA